jgi:hypothetical protein
MSTRTALTRKIRAARNNRAFERALRDASPTMRNELFAAAAAQQGQRFSR